MKILVMGSGGVGGLYGGRLARAGCDVTFVARGAHLAALRERGLTIENAAQGDIRIPRVKTTEDPGTAGTADPAGTTASNTAPRPAASTASWSQWNCAERRIETPPARSRAGVVIRPRGECNPS